MPIILAVHGHHVLVVGILSVETPNAPSSRSGTGDVGGLAYECWVGINPAVALDLIQG